MATPTTILNNYLPLLFISYTTFYLCLACCKKHMPPRHGKELKPPIPNDNMLLPPPAMPTPPPPPLPNPAAPAWPSFQRPLLPPLFQFPGLPPLPKLPPLPFMLPLPTIPSIPNPFTPGLETNVGSPPPPPLVDVEGTPCPPNN